MNQYQHACLLTHCMLCNFVCFCRLLIFFFIFSNKNSFNNTIEMSNDLDPDLGPNCLQTLSAEDTSRQRVKSYRNQKSESIHVHTIAWLEIALNMKHP